MQRAPAWVDWDWFVSPSHAAVGADAKALGAPLLLFSRRSAPDPDPETFWIVDESGAPVTIAAIAAVTSMSPRRVRAALERLEAVKTIRRRADGAIGFARATIERFQAADFKASNGGTGNAARCRRHRLRTKQSASEHVGTHVAPMSRDMGQSMSRHGAKHVATCPDDTGSTRPTIVRADAEDLDLNPESGEFRSEKRENSPPLSPSFSVAVRAMLLHGRNAEPPPHELAGLRALTVPEKNLGDRERDGWTVERIGDLVYGVAAAIARGELARTEWSPKLLTAFASDYEARLDALAARRREIAETLPTPPMRRSAAELERLLAVVPENLRRG